MSKNYCHNCGSSKVEKQITQSPSDDWDEWWCNGCDLPVDVGPLTPKERRATKRKYLHERELIKELLRHL